MCVLWCWTWNCGTILHPCVYGTRELLLIMGTVTRGLLHLRLLHFERSVTRIFQIHCRLSFFIAGLTIASDVLIGKSTWDALFQPPNFFSKYKYMISPFCVCLNVTLSISSSGLYCKPNVHLKFDAIKICFGSVVFYWWSVCVNNSFKYSRWKKQTQQFTCDGKTQSNVGVFCLTPVSQAKWCKLYWLKFSN